LELVPIVADDAEELAEVFGDERLYVFLGGRPTTTEELRAQFARLAAGVAWQGQRIASEAARAVVGWLERRGVATITAHMHPDHHASATVASRAGLRPTGEYREHGGVREHLWRRLVEAPSCSAHPSG
jgi:predicted N-acetyltransferase YhbS